MVPIAPSRTCTLPSPIKSRRVGILPIIVQVGRQPAFDGGHVECFTAGVILHLVPLDLADAKVLGLRMPEVVSADRSGWQHGKALRESHTRLPLRPEQIE